MTMLHSSDTHRHAIVIGGGFAGLLSARVLADHFTRVTIVERDGLAMQPEPRKGVPQGHHIHGLLLKGQHVLTQLFPDLIPALIDGGAVAIDMGLDFHWYHHGVWKARFDSGIAATLFTRPYLEWQIAQRVCALPHVTVVNAAVEGLRFASDRRRVAGVEIRARDHGDAAIDGDLIVDASGRGSQTARWLGDIGYKTPVESTVKVNVTYGSRLYRPSCEKQQWKALLISSHPRLKRMGAVFSVEGDRWLVSLGGLHGERPPIDDAGYLEFARHLAVPDVYEAIAGAEPLTPIATHRFSTNLRRHYEHLTSFPEGLLVIGDAVCSFNPIYGQGMTASALEAIALKTVLSQHIGSGDLAGLPGRFHKIIAKIVDAPWRLTTGEDFRHAETTGRRPPGTALLHWYTRRLHERCACDPSLALSFYRVMHMIDAPRALFRPSVIAHVLGRNRRQTGKVPTACVAEDP